MREGKALMVKLGPAKSAALKRWALKRWGEWHSRFDEPPGIHARRALRLCSDEDLLGFMFAEGEIIAADSNLNRIAQGRKADEFDGSTDQETHFHQSRAAFG